MPSTMPSGMTFKSLCIELAEYAGIASYTNPDDSNDNRARVPSDPGQLDQVRRKVNEGYLRLFCAHPEEWSFYTGELALTLKSDGSGPANLNSEPQLYVLPSFVRHVAGDASYTANTSAIRECQLVDHDILRRSRDTYHGQLGTPKIFAIKKHTPTGPQARALTVLEFWPKPDQDYELVFPVSVTPVELVADDDRPVCGLIHDDTIVAAAKFAWARAYESEADPQRVANAKAEYQEALAKSLVNDRRERPSRVGTLRSWRNQRPGPNNVRPPATYTYNGVPIT